MKEIVRNELFDEWTSHDGKIPHLKSAVEIHAQENRYDPDNNDKMRINIMPLQNTGSFAAYVIAKKDAEKAIAEHAEWQVDERRR
jgi:hypothetical protein